MQLTTKTDLLCIHRTLQSHFGDLHWWPAKNAFEVVVGAILTQNTSWQNVEKAIGNLRLDGVLTPLAMAQKPREQLERLIRPAGYYRQKALHLQNLAQDIFANWGGDIECWCAGPLELARQRLLKYRGIGPETADSILLYAAHRPTFVVDAYTYRIFTRLGLLNGNESYQMVRKKFMSNLPQDVRLFNAYHAEIVHLAKEFCRKRDPSCGTCPIEQFCSYAK